MELIEYADREMLYLSLANQVAGELGQALRSAGRASLAVAGGSSTPALLDLLCEVELDWQNVFVMPTDERCVPEDNPRSNLGLIRRRLLRGPAAQARALPLFVAGDAPGLDTATLAADLAPALPLTTAVLGMGEDMHTASLFPGGDQLTLALSNGAPALVDMQAPGLSEPRVTLTLPVFKAAMSLHLVIAGAAKREALERARNLPTELAPVRALVENATVHWAE